MKTMTDIRVVDRGDPQWPGCLHSLDGAERLWLRGPLNLADAMRRSVAIVGSPACTP